VRAARLAVVTVVVLAIIGLVTWWGGRDGAAPAAIDRSPVPAATSGSTLSSTWYCSAGTAAVPVRHSILLSNPTSRPVTVRLTAFGGEGRRSARSLVVPANGPKGVDVGAAFGDQTLSVMVESPVGSLAVDHSLVGTDYGDQDACATFSSGEWYFPSLVTTRDAGTRLTLFNPFPADAGLDVEVVLDTGVRTPTALTGIVVPAGTAKVVDLGQTVQRRDQFSVAVHLRSGRVVAEATETFDGSAGARGLRMGLGVPASGRHWAFAGGFTGTGVGERLVIQNPGLARTTVLIQVTPYGGAANPPEPLQVEVPRLRSAVVDLSAENRIPGDGYHSITVEADHPVVVARTTTITAGPTPPADPKVPTRPALSKGVAIATGAPVGALRWLVPTFDAGRTPAPVLFVHNPGNGIAVVTVKMLVGGVARAVPAAADVEVAPGDSIAVQVPSKAPATVSLEVTASSPVVVERLVTYPAQDDLSFDLAVPVRGDRSPLTALLSGG
jgi:hypothetical protein